MLHTQSLRPNTFFKKPTFVIFCRSKNLLTISKNLLPMISRIYLNNFHKKNRTSCFFTLKYQWMFNRSYCLVEFFIKIPAKKLVKSTYDGHTTYFVYNMDDYTQNMAMDNMQNFTLKNLKMSSYNEPLKAL